MNHGILWNIMSKIHLEKCKEGNIKGRADLSGYSLLSVRCAGVCKDLHEIPQSSVRKEEKQAGAAQVVTHKF